MTDPYVTVPFNAARAVRESGKVFILDEENLVLPKSQVTLHRDGDDRAVSATMPRWLAEKKGLVDTEDQPEDMTRHDWFLLGATMALLIRGDPESTAVWEGNKVAASLEKLCQNTL